MHMVNVARSMYAAAASSPAVSREAVAGVGGAERSASTASAWADAECRIGALRWHTGCEPVGDANEVALLHLRMV
jgi:hypothetical protein